MTAGVRRCRSRPCCVFGLQGPPVRRSCVPVSCRVMTPGGAGPAAVAEPAGQGNRVGAVSVTAPIPAVRGQRFSCPVAFWRRGTGRVADGGGQKRVSQHVSAGQRRLTWVEGERSVKPSAQPTLVRTQHLPHPGETARWLRRRGPAGRFLLVTACIRVCHRGSMHSSGCVHMVYSVQPEGAVRITAPFAIWWPSAMEKTRSAGGKPATSGPQPRCPVSGRSCLGCAPR